MNGMLDTVGKGQICGSINSHSFPRDSLSIFDPDRLALFLRVITFIKLI